MRVTIAIGAANANPILAAFDAYAEIDGIEESNRYHCTDLQQALNTIQTLSFQNCAGALLLLSATPMRTSTISQHLNNLRDGLKAISGPPPVTIIVEVRREIECTGGAVWTWLSDYSVALFLSSPVADGDPPLTSGDGQKRIFVDKMRAGLRQHRDQKTLPSGGGKRVFVSTPYAQPGSGSRVTQLHQDSRFLQEFLREMGCLAPFEIEKFTGDDLHRKVMKDIQTCDVVLANVGLCEAVHSRRNAHVYMELGAAICQDKPLWLFRPSIDKDDELPSMSRVKDQILYDSAPDLGWQIYHRFGEFAKLIK